MSTTLNPPNIQVDETLYSYLARCQWLWGYTNHNNVSKDWFGKAGICLSQCLPCHLNDFINNTGWLLDGLIESHTAIPLHVSFNVRYELLRGALANSHQGCVANLACAPQLASGYQGQSFVCPECMREDIERIGVAYWHLTHQLWGVRACYKHHCLLHALPFNPRKYRLPQELVDYQGLKSTPANPYQIRFAELVVGSLHNPKSLLAQQQHIISILKAKSLLTNQSRIKSTFILEHFNQVVSDLGVKVSLSRTMIRRISFSKDLSIHPLKGFAFLFTLEHMPPFNKRPNLARPALRKSDAVEANALALLKSYKFNVAEISRRLKISVGFVRKLAKRKGVHIRQNMKEITPDIERKVILDAIENIRLLDIATKWGISEASVCDIVQSVEGLSLWRQYSRMLEKREENRELLIKEKLLNPQISKRGIISLHPNATAWAYKYDGTWLKENFPNAKKRVNHSYKIWQKRDKELLLAFKKFLRRFISINKKLPSKYALDKEFGNHRWFSNHFSKMPKCKRLYEWALKRLNDKNRSN